MTLNFKRYLKLQVIFWWNIMIIRICTMRSDNTLTPDRDLVIAAIMDKSRVTFASCWPLSLGRGHCKQLLHCRAHALSKPCSIEQEFPYYGERTSISRKSVWYISPRCEMRPHSILLHLGVPVPVGGEIDNDRVDPEIPQSIAMPPYQLLLRQPTLPP
ncbi:hypothetical protein HAX54_028535 [Datura stramonium]|uniref:Uncharacterized protein n=1 Tax=Datura stramonium TaxID=4076 RepID=A0ABS8V5I0_DATST|nr:hypothetical protein [Datura stramonium]